jgi:DNA repair protein RAD5
MNHLFARLKPILEDSDDKVVIFSHFIGFMELLKYDFTRENITFLTFDGSLSNKRRDEVLKLFSSQEGPRILIVSIKCGGVGLNLVSANHVFLMEPWWNPAFEHQAIDRVYRIGQSKDVFITRFVCSDTVEERIKLIQEDKMELARTTLVQTAEQTKNQNLQNFKKLFI